MERVLMCHYGPTLTLLLILKEEFESQDGNEIRDGGDIF